MTRVIERAQDSSLTERLWREPSSWNRRDAGAMLLLTAIAIAFYLPFFYAAEGQMPDAHDLRVHWMRMIEFDEALRSGVWYPRWLGGLNYGYGAATTLFYPPLFYYAVSAANAVLGDWSRALAAVALFAAAGSAVAFYLYARLLMSRAASVAASVLYLTLPYHLIDLYHRAAMPELITFVWMPLVMFFFTSCVKRFKAWKLAGAAMAFALLVITHPPVTYLFSLSLAVFAIGWSGLSRSFKPAIFAVSFAAIGGALSAFYSLPAVAEVSYAKESITSSYIYADSYLESLIGRKGFWLMIAATIIVTTAMVVIYSSFAIAARNWIEREAARANFSLSDQHLILWLVVGAMAFFMMSAWSRPTLKLLPSLEAVAFPWRWLAITAFAASTAAGIAIERAAIVFARSKQAQAARYAKLCLVAIAALTVGLLIFSSLAAARASNLKTRFVPPTLFVEDDFMPEGAPTSADLPRGDSVKMLSSDPESAARVIEWKPQERLIETFSPSSDTLLVSSFMFPGWVAFVDGRQAQLRAQPHTKVILLDVEPGAHTIKLVFAATQIRKRAEQISSAALCLCVLLLASGAFARKGLFQLK